MDWLEQFIQRHRLPARYAENAVEHLGKLANSLGDFRESAGKPPVIGISGAQGSGKTTLALFLAKWLEREMGRSTACLSLDDFYLRKSQRQELALTVHPLFATRGVPGTHDVPLAQRTLDALARIDTPRDVAVPVFDKARDDRMPAAEWQIVHGPVDLILLEGWCVGARPQRIEALASPVNQLEATEDPWGIWRRHVNERLQEEYADLFARLELLIMLRVPSFEKVSEWRSLQERKLRERVLREASSRTAARGQSDAELIRFVQHYERLTRHMLKTMPDFADAVIDIDNQHRMTRITRRKHSV